MKKMLFLLLFSALGFGQSMSEYQYIILPAKFEAQKSAGQFNLNNITKLFLERNGYKVFFDNDILPADVSSESCNKLYGNVTADNNFRTTKLRFEVKDCRNAVILSSGIGQSTEKDNNIAYNRALRDALKSIDKPEFMYSPAAKPAAPKVVETVAPVSKPKEVAQNAQTTQVTSSEETLSVQKIANGYQLVDTTPKIVLRMFATTNPEVFIGEADGKKGVVLKKDGNWVFEYYNGTQLKSESLPIKF